MNMKIGYARVSTHEQNLSLQTDALNQAGCEVIFTDQGTSGADFHRPGLHGALESLTAGDVLVVWRLDRLGRSLTKLIDLVSNLGKQDIDFVSLTECINTKYSGGVLVFHLMAALAEFERTVISERTRAGIAAAKLRGKPIGRKRALSPAQRARAMQLLSLTQSPKQVAKEFNVHPRTLRRMVLEEQDASTMPSHETHPPSELNETFDKR
jgi:DNA invertase Pin-like site-specific DNA recombinase